MKPLRQLIKWAIFSLLPAAILVCAFLYYRQTEMIFAELRFHSQPVLELRRSHPALVRVPLSTRDGVSLEVWKLPATGEPQSSSKAAVFFRGNAGALEQFLGYADYLSSLGMTVYYFNYRGYGESTGYPTEAGVDEDASAVVSFALADAHVSPSELMLFGVSLGTGPAAYAAEKFSPGMLVLVAPYSSIDAVVSDTYFKPFVPLLTIHFPVQEYVKHLPNTCVVVTAGKQDDVISWHNSERIASSAHSRQLTVLFDDEARHHDIFWRVKDKVLAAITQCSAAH